MIRHEPDKLATHPSQSLHPAKLKISKRSALWVNRALRRKSTMGLLLEQKAQNGGSKQKFKQALGLLVAINHKQATALLSQQQRCFSASLRTH